MQSKYVITGLKSKRSEIFEKLFCVHARACVCVLRGEIIFMLLKL